MSPRKNGVGLPRSSPKRSAGSAERSPRAFGRRHGRLTVAIFALLLLSSPAPGEQAEFLSAWKTATSQPDRAGATWRQFAAAHPKTDFARLARLMIGVDHLRARRYAEAIPQFDVSPGEQPSAFRKQLIRAGKSLRARVEMVRIGERLREYYRRHVEYPNSLDALPGTSPVDPFGEPYAYEATPRPTMPDVPRQVYELRCATTGTERGDLRRDLDRLGKPPEDLALSSVNVDRQQAYVKRREPTGGWGPSRSWDLGETRDGLTLWRVSEACIIAARRDMPLVMMMDR